MTTAAETVALADTAGTGVVRCSTPGAVTALRAATRRCHERLDAGLAEVLAALDVATYADHLRRQAILIAPLEDAVAAAVADDAALHVAVDARRRAALLVVDRRRLADDHSTEPGIAEPEHGGSAVVPALASIPAALGAWYVLEGSTLGGRVVTRLVRDALGSDAPVDFLSSGGADVVARWAQTRALLAARLVTETDVAVAVAAATAVFGAFTEVLLP